MRTLVLPLLMAALSATASKPEKMFVVIHTTDMVIVNYICYDNANSGADNPILGSSIRSTGGYNWHVVGGVAPYTIIKNEMRTMTGGCITVMDAEGTIATSCGTIGVREERQQINCQREQDRLDHGPYGLVPNDSTDKARVGWKTGPNDRTAPPVIADPSDSYVPPVRGPVPTVDPPQGPKPPVTFTKPERRSPKRLPGANNPPPVDHSPVLPSTRSPKANKGSGTTNLGPQPSRAPGNNTAPQRLSQPVKVQ